MSTGVVVIGRNEGARLTHCLQSMVGAAGPVVYVDSGSSDGSIENARAYGAEIVDLDLSTPFTAGRARNSGFEALVSAHPGTERVQFVDGDCALEPGWLERADTVLAERSDVSVVCGRLTERFPEASIYNRLCDMEWHRPPGLVAACGGIFMVRRADFEAVAGFDARLIAGEEPDLCARIRARGGRVLRLPDSMARHDADMMHLSQWWTRARRSGYASLEGWLRHLGSGTGYYGRTVASNLLWSVGLPLVTALAIAVAGPAAAGLLLAYPVMILRIALGRRRTSGDAPEHCLLFAAFTMLGKLPGFAGQVGFLRDRLLRRSGGLIEYRAVGK